MVKVIVLVNLTNFENIRFESSEFDDVELCYQELEDALQRLKSFECQQFVDCYLRDRDYKDKYGLFHEGHKHVFKKPIEVKQ